MFHAIVIVVEGDDEDEAWESITEGLPDTVQFVGNPWQVTPHDVERGFDTEACIEQFLRQ